MVLIQFHIGLVQTDARIMMLANSQPPKKPKDQPKKQPKDQPKKPPKDQPKKQPKDQPKTKSEAPKRQITDSSQPKSKSSHV